MVCNFFGSFASAAFCVASLLTVSPALGQPDHDEHVSFSHQSVRSGKWSDADTWKPARVPGQGDRVLVRRGTTVEYDAKQQEVVRLLQIVGTLNFARDRDTELNVGILTIQHTDECSEHGFACEFEGTMEGPTTASEHWPSPIVGTPEQPIPAEYTARIRLRFFEGMNAKDAPAIACCSGRMELHGSPLFCSWVKLGADVSVGAKKVTLSEKIAGWRVGDEVIVTATSRAGSGAGFRPGSRRAKEAQTEQRTITAIDEATLTLDQPLKFAHSGRGAWTLLNTLPSCRRYDARKQCLGGVDRRFAQPLDHDSRYALPPGARLRWLQKRWPRLFFGGWDRGLQPTGSQSCRASLSRTASSSAGSAVRSQ